ncbi:hypothetical protein GQR58_023686 [Nymphon striatum]|nr:hypothetical protein GQR58_023686 [Nymphon striatum]
MQLQKLKKDFEEIRNVERISVEILKAFDLIAEIKENFAKYFNFATLVWFFSSFSHVLGHMNYLWVYPTGIMFVDPVISLLIIWWWTTELQKVTQEADSLKNVIAKLCFLNLNFKEKHFQQINMLLFELTKSPLQITVYQYFVVDKKFFIADSVFYSMGMTVFDIASIYRHALYHLVLVWMTLLIDINIMQLQKLKKDFEEIRNVERISVEILKAFDLIAEIKENFAKYFNFAILVWFFSSFSHILGHMNSLWVNPTGLMFVDPVISLLTIWWWTTELQKVTQEINMLLFELTKSPLQITVYQYFVIDNKFFIANINLIVVNFNKTMVNFKEFERYPFCYSFLVLSGLMPIYVDDHGNSKIKWKNLVPTVILSLIVGFNALMKAAILVEGEKKTWGENDKNGVYRDFPSRIFSGFRIIFCGYENINIMQLQKLKKDFEEIRNVERISVEILKAFDLIAEIKENFAKYFNFATLVWFFSSFSHVLGHMNYLWVNPTGLSFLDPVISLLIIWWWTTELQKVTQEADSLKNVIAHLCFLDLNFKEKHFQQINMLLCQFEKSPPQITVYQYFVIDKKFFMAVISALATYSIIIFQFH